MPRGDNQHQFTCPACQQRKPSTEKCGRSGYCQPCCKAGDACLRHCDACDSDYANCYSRNRAAKGCDLCLKHKCTSGPAAYAVYRCQCVECTSCHQLRSASHFMGPNGSRQFTHPCLTCHAATPDCRHHVCCGLNITAALPEQDCCGRCEPCCNSLGCAGEINPEFFNMPMDRMPDGSEVPRPVLSGLGQFQFNPSKRTIGLELEYGAIKNGKLTEAAVKNIGGAIVGDGTALFEINTPPMNGDKFVHSMAYLSESLIKSKARVNERVAMHVHVGCLDFDWADMRRLVMLYGRLESGIYSIIDPRRATGAYSKPNGGRSLTEALHNPITPREDLIRMTYGVEKSRESPALWTGKGPAGNNGRYWGLNLHSWFYRGTVEFRMHHGTSRWEKMVGFSMLLAAMADGALSIPEREIVNFPQGKEGLLKIAPTPWVRDWVKERWDHFAAKRKNKSEPIADF